MTQNSIIVLKDNG